MQEIPGSYFYLSYAVFLLMPTVVKIQPHIFNGNIRKRPQDGDITPLFLIFVFIHFFHTFPQRLVTPKHSFAL